MSKILYIASALTNRGYVYDLLTSLVAKGHFCEKTAVGPKSDLQVGRLDQILRTSEFDLVIIDRDCLSKHRGAAEQIQKDYSNKLILLDFVETQDVFLNAIIVKPLAYNKKDLLKKIEEYLPKDQI